MKEEIIDLFDEYRHYKAMTAGFFASVFLNNGESFRDFMWWLKSNNK